VIGSLFDRTVGDASDIQGHLVRLRDLVVELDALVVVELGVRYGKSTVALLAGVEQTAGLVWSCDADRLPLPPEVTDHPQWEFVAGDDLAMVAYAPSPVDLLFIDTSHEYEHTLAELAAYGPLVRRGGAVALHDTDPVLWPGCARAVREWFESVPGARLEFYPGHNGLTIVRF
jgi:cephalosporin hydroxylase